MCVGKVKNLWPEGVLRQFKSRIPKCFDILPIEKVYVLFSLNSGSLTA